MSDFLATLAAQALNAAPFAYPLVPAKYAPMPPIGGVGALESLRAGGGMPAPPPEGSPPGQGRLDLPPQLVEPSAYGAAYFPFSYLQLRQAGGYPATPALAAGAGVAVEPGIEPPALVTDGDGEAVNGVTATEPAPGAAAGRSTVVASSEPAGQAVYAATDAASPSAPSTPPPAAATPAMTEQPASTASVMLPATERSAPASDPVALRRPEDPAPALLAKPSSDAEPLPRPVADSGLQASVGSGDQPQALQVQPPAGAMQPALRPEVAAPPPAARSPHADTIGPPVKANAGSEICLKQAVIEPPF